VLLAPEVVEAVAQRNLEALYLEHIPVAKAQVVEVLVMELAAVLVLVPWISPKSF